MMESTLGKQTLTWTVTLSLFRARRQWNLLSYCRNIFLFSGYYDTLTSLKAPVNSTIEYGISGEESQISTN